MVMESWRGISLLWSLFPLSRYIAETNQGFCALGGIDIEWIQTIIRV